LAVTSGHAAAVFTRSLWRRRPALPVLPGHWARSAQVQRQPPPRWQRPPTTRRRGRQPVAGVDSSCTWRSRDEASAGTVVTVGRLALSPPPAAAHDIGLVQAVERLLHRGAHPARPCPSSILLDKNRRDIGKSQSIWTDPKMETAGSRHVEPLRPARHPAPSNLTPHHRTARTHRTLVSMRRRRRSRARSLVSWQLSRPHHSHAAHSVTAAAAAAAGDRRTY
jgi:hypothetical protein